MPSSSTALPPPTGGWDARSSYADMPPENAIIMDNWMPGTADVMTRRGNSAHATGMTGDVESLIEYIPRTANGELFSANAGDIYDVTSSGAIGAAVSTGHTNDRWQHVQIGTAAGHFVRMVNGDDTPLVYNGSSWGTTPTITGPTAADLVWINIHQRRMWIGEKESLNAYYLPVNSVGGSATAFSLEGLAGMGGYIMAMGTWSRSDAGLGMDDAAVFYTSEGQVIVYQGTDPASATTWGLLGVFNIGKPIGRRCMKKAGADIILVTQDGFVPLSAILSIDTSQTRLVALSDQISQAVNDSVRNGAALFGWQPIMYPKGTMMLFNIPQSAGGNHQYVFNTITGAPARFTGIDAVCWGMLNGDLYWGSKDGKVNKFDDGSNDLGSNIVSDALQAFNYFKSPSVNKAFKNVEPIFQGGTDPNSAIDLNLDFKIKTPTGTSQASATTAALWGVGLWGVGVWGSALQIWDGWRGVRGVGRAAAIRIRIDSGAGQTSWLSTNFVYVRGGMM